METTELQKCFLDTITEIFIDHVGFEGIVEAYLGVLRLFLGSEKSYLPFLTEESLESHLAWFKSYPTVDIDRLATLLHKFIAKMPFNRGPQVNWIQFLSPQMESRMEFVVELGADGFGLAVVLFIIMNNVTQEDLCSSSNSSIKLPLSMLQYGMESVLSYYASMEIKPPTTKWNTPTIVSSSISSRTPVANKLPTPPWVGASSSRSVVAGGGREQDPRASVPPHSNANLSRTTSPAVQQMTPPSTTHNIAGGSQVDTPTSHSTAPLLVLHPSRRDGKGKDSATRKRGRPSATPSNVQPNAGPSNVREKSNEEEEDEEDEIEEDDGGQESNPEGHDNHTLERSQRPTKKARKKMRLSPESKAERANEKIEKEL
ncbi:hypothetical protein SCHPADRAFT_1002984, partial [Schizopora paradoxa]